MLGVAQSDLTLDGRLVFREVQYEDGVEITCIATHSISGAEESITLRLRVRGKCCCTLGGEGVCIGGRVMNNLPLTAFLESEDKL